MIITLWIIFISGLMLVGSAFVIWKEEKDWRLRILAIIIALSYPTLLNYLYKYPEAEMKISKKSKKVPDGDY